MRPGKAQVGRLVAELHDTPIDHLYASPCRSAQQTAEALAADHRLKVKTLDELQNLDHGLWHGKLIEEVRTQPAQGLSPASGPPGNRLPARGRAGRRGPGARRAAIVNRLVRKHRDGTIALVVPEPLASLVRAHSQPDELGDLWKAECEVRRLADDRRPAGEGGPGKLTAAEPVTLAASDLTDRQRKPRRMSTPPKPPT